MASHQQQLEEEEELHRIRHGIIPTGDLYDELQTICSGARNVGFERSEETCSVSSTLGQTIARDHLTGIASGLAG
jgi:hypothetical protein